MKTLIKLIVLLVILGLTGFYFLYRSWVYAPIPKRAGIVPSDYFAARNIFLKKAQAVNAEITSHKIAAKGPSGQDLFIDVAWIGSKTPTRALLHISGTHGVEGFAGSAIQSEILDQFNGLPHESSALIFIHALNPWGMAHYRRFNENNVDLNRNVFLDPNSYQGAPEDYKKVEWFLNPKDPPEKFDAFVLDALKLIIKHGFTTLKQAIAGGQYEYPKGIYYGGSELQESSKFLIDWVKEHLTEVKILFVIEIHTGLGVSGADTLFWQLPIADIRTRLLSEYLGEHFQSDEPDAGVGFVTPGDLQNEIPKLIKSDNVGWTLQEFGAYGPVTTLRALMNENRHHFYGDGTIDHWSKHELLEAFTPGSGKWQVKVVSRGHELASKIIPLLHPEESIKH